METVETVEDYHGALNTLVKQGVHETGRPVNRVRPRFFTLQDGSFAS
jgi:hypothetical protein